MATWNMKYIDSLWCRRTGVEVLERTSAEALDKSSHGALELATSRGLQSSFARDRIFGTGDWILRRRPDFCTRAWILFQKRILCQRRDFCTRDRIRPSFFLAPLLCSRNCMTQRNFASAMTALRSTISVGEKLAASAGRATTSKIDCSFENEIKMKVK